MRTILCVDDDREEADALRSALQNAGYAVREAGCCAEALQRAREGFDLALINLPLPDGDCATIASQLHALRPDAEIIMLTGFATVESAVAAVRAGAWAYLVKPCAVPEILLTLEQAIRQVAHVEANRALERRARVAEKLAAIGTLTAGLSHEIKNPLNAAWLQLVLLERRLGRLPAASQEGLFEPLRLVKDEISRLSRLLEEFLHFAQPRQIQLRSVDVIDVLERVVGLLAADAEARGLRIESRGEALPPIQADEGSLQQAVMNLILNAIQAAPPGGVVRVSTALSEGAVEVTIEDSGPGVPDELAARVFEPFFTTKEGGSGLGLPLVHGIVEQHGGSLTLGRGELGGARFVMRLPKRG